MISTPEQNETEKSSLERYLRGIGVVELPPTTAPLDPGYDPVTVEAHLEQSSEFMEIFKLSMACWQLAGERTTRRKILAARRHGVPTVAGGGPFEIAVQQGALEQYLDLCGDLGFSRIECGSGFTEHGLEPAAVVEGAGRRGLDVQYELGKKLGGTFTGAKISELVDEGRRWLDAGAVQLVVEGRESGKGVGVFDDQGRLVPESADRFAAAFGLENVCFEAPVKPNQFALLDHFGPEVRLSNVRLEEVLRVEIYRRGLHSDAFANPLLRPAPPVRAETESETVLEAVSP